MLAWNAPVKYITIEPGPTFDTLGQAKGKALITVSGAPATKSDGQLRMVTIGELQGMSTFDVIKAWLEHERRHGAARSPHSGGSDPAAE